jgi:polysaccharide pyruvyl transferase CsaB
MTITKGADTVTVIHLVSGGDFGGAKTHVLSLLAGLNQAMQTVLICFQDGAFAQDAIALGLDVRIVASRNPSSSLQTLKAAVTEIQPDVIHCHGSRANMMGMLLKRRCKLPVLTTVHSDYNKDYLGRPLQAVSFGLVNRYSLRKLDYRIGVSSAMKNILIQRKFSPYSLFTIYGGIDFGERTVPVMTDADKMTVLSGFGIDSKPGDVIAGCAARLNPVKDIATLLRAAARIRDTDPHTRLKILIAGQGEQETMLKRLVSQLRLDGMVTFIGWVEDTEKLFSVMDINVLTSISECFPYVLLEGARFGLATVSTDVGGIPDFITHEKNGLLFKPKDIAALGDYLKRLTDDGALRRKLGQSLYETGKTNFSMQRMIETQREIYETVLRRAARPSVKRDRIVLCGAYGRGNVGDDAILQSALAGIRDIDPDLRPVVLSRHPAATRRDFGVDALYTFNLFRFLRHLNKSKLFINGGGNLLQDVTSKRSLWFYLFTIWIARFAKNRILMYGCGIGPVKGRYNRRLTAKILNRNVDAITLREPRSKRELAEYGVTRPGTRLTADLALSLQAAAAENIDAFFASRGLAPQGDYVCIALRQWPGFNPICFGQLADAIVKQLKMIPVFLPIENIHDICAVEEAVKHATVPCIVLPHIGDPSVVIGVLSRMKVVISMRLHALIFAAGQGVPVIAVSYDEKVDAFMEHLGQPQVIGLHELSYEQLMTFLHQTLTADKQTLREGIRRLRELEKENTVVLREILETL